MTEHEMRERVIRGLEQYKEAGWTGINDYYRPFVSDALDLLKAQEPRVMTLEDLQRAQDDEVPIWFESRGTWHGRKGFWIFVYDIIKNGMRYNAGHMCSYGVLGLSAINKTWRCWTSRPTDTQREATPWTRH